jgi:hypothetical protein
MLLIFSTEFRYKSSYQNYSNPTSFSSNQCSVMHNASTSSSWSVNSTSYAIFYYLSFEHFGGIFALYLLALLLTIPVLYSFIKNCCIALLGVSFVLILEFLVADLFQVESSDIKIMVF